MDSKKVQLYLDREKAIEASPVTGANCVILSDGNDLQNALDNDLTTPTVVHEETSFKVGVGDIDVSGSIVEGEVGRMVIKGQTYQNILPEPSLRNSMTNGKTMQRLNEGYDSVNTVDGVCKSAILKGQTLVNLLGNYPEQTFTLDNTWQQRNIPIEYTNLIKPNTTYTFVFNVTECQMADSTKSNLQIGDDHVFNNMVNLNLKLGVNTYKLTTKDSITFPLKLYGSAYNSGTLTFNLMLLEGDYVGQNIPHFNGMQSVKMPVLTTTGKNLFDGNLINGYYEDGTLNKIIGGNENIYKTIKLNLKKGTYTFSFEESVRFIRQVKDGVYEVLGGDFTKFTTTLNTDGIYVLSFRKTDNTDFDLTHIQVEQGSIATSYEPYKTNILHTPEEVVLRSLPNGVKDTLNLNTGEYVQRIGEIVLDGSENWVVDSNVFNNTYRFALTISNMIRKDWHDIITQEQFVKSNVFKSLDLRVEAHNLDTEHLTGWDVSRMILNINKAKLSENSVNALKTYLQQNPITVQYQLATESIKTVDLSTSGNWEKVVLNGSENWSITNNTHLYTKLSDELSPDALLPVLDNSSFVPSENTNSSVNAVWYGGNVGSKNGNIVFNVLDKTLEQFKQCLSQNPITVWYPTVTHQDSTQVKQPIFFKDGHVQLSSGADNSLIPTLDYQAKTSNSYVMDLMKVGTTYTMKASSVSGTAAIGDAGAFTLNTNRTIISPPSSLIGNKLLVIKGSATELMILEGDVTDKTIPYFKGIKSAFEDESKIEVLSTGKNLFDGKWVCGQWINVDNGIQEPLANRACVENYIQVKPSTNYAYNFTYESNEEINGRAICLYDIDKQFIGATSTYNVKSIFTTPNNAHYIKYSVYTTSNAPLSKQDVETFKFQIEESSTQTSYEPYKSNSTKIPLLSSLRSLPNGVKDEVVVDRMKNKVTLIQRVGKVVFDGSEEWYCNWSNDGNCHNGHTNIYDAKKVVGTSFICNKFRESTTTVNNPNYESAFMTGRDNWFGIAIHKDKLDTYDAKGMKKWLSQNPLVVYYELETPVVTEIDLENFPLVYKDGHIFLNSEIAPVIEIDYNVNQAQQIQANNETLQRHELDILDLDNLIVSFVNAEYNLRLLKFDMELSMMTLAE